VTKEVSIKEWFLVQLNLFYLALSFFTRLPVPKSMQYSSELLNQSNRYFSLVGLLLGLILSSCFYLLCFAFPQNIAILLIMMLSLLLTGAFHEDGLTDMADGIGGAFEVERRLEIMKDSRIGTYGAATLVISLALKFSLLQALAQYSLSYFIIAILLGYSLSRALAASLISALPYVSDEGHSKSKPLAQSQSVKDIIILVLFGSLPLFMYSFSISLSVILTLLLFRFVFVRWLLAKVGGFTGDCLGAAQQISELLIYLVLVFFIYDKNLIEPLNLGVAAI
jgi:adenosylcobinamide-GDP ribazoletransferase